MNRNPPLSQVLLLIGVLIAGPLQAQHMFACEMMDEVLNECCCVGHKSEDDSLDTDRDGAVNTDPCCELSVVVSIDENAMRDTPLVRQVEVRSDMDPPPAAVESVRESISLQPRIVNHLNSSLSIPRQSGSDIYLLTQRLRI